MKIYKKSFLGLDSEYTIFDKAKVIIAPFCYEGGISYGKGTAKGPLAIIDASYYLELYDEVLKTEPYKVGISTVAPPALPKEPELMVQKVYETAKQLLNKDKFIVSIGGDHSVTTGYFKALYEKYKRVSVIQLDAHADLRESYNGSKYSHASIMARIRDITCDTLQIGIRSLSKKEALRVESEKIALCTMHNYRNQNFNIDLLIKNLPDPVFITLDVDVLDWSVIRSTGTPEPGGFLWDEFIMLLYKIFSLKNVAGFDVVELSYNKDDITSAFAAAKLIYKMIGFKFYI